MAIVPSGRRWSAGGIIEIIIGASVWPKSWAIPAVLVERLVEAAHRHRGRAVPEALEAGQVAACDAGMAEQHVDQRGRQEGVGDVVPADEVQEVGQVRRPHDHDLAAEGEHREAQHPGGVGEGRQGEVDRARPERVAHQRQRGHRLEVRPVSMHALGPPGGAPGADDHGQVVGRFGLPRSPLRPSTVEGRGARELVVEADQGGEPGQPRRGSCRPAARTRPGRSGTCSRRSPAGHGSRPPRCAG